MASEGLTLDGARDRPRRKADGTRDGMAAAPAAGAGGNQRPGLQVRAARWRRSEVLVCASLAPLVGGRRRPGGRRGERSVMTRRSRRLRASREAHGGPRAPWGGRSVLWSPHGAMVCGYGVGAVVLRGPADGDRCARHGSARRAMQGSSPGVVSQDPPAPGAPAPRHTSRCRHRVTAPWRAAGNFDSVLVAPERGSPGEQRVRTTGNGGRGQRTHAWSKALKSRRPRRSGRRRQRQEGNGAR